MKIGTTDILNTYCGEDEIIKIYEGTDMVYSGGSEPTPPTPTPSGTSVPFTVEVLSAGTWVFSEDEHSSVIEKLDYSINGGSWIKGGPYEGDDVPYVTAITFNAGDTIAFRGTEYGGLWLNGGKGDFISPDSQYGGLTVPYNVYGNIFSLVTLYYTDFTDIQDLVDNYDFDNFSMLFGAVNENTYLIDASELLIPTDNVTEYFGESMFWNCTSLTTAPALPATTLADSCYENMFEDCTSLTTAPSILPATTLANYCYRNMFTNCTSLTTAPELPATTLAENCYQSMFYYCTSLITAPDLLAEEYVKDCYYEMFGSCENLSSIKIATYILDVGLSESPCQEMLTNVAQQGVIYVTQDAYDILTNDMIDQYNYELLPEGWSYSIYNNS